MWKSASWKLVEQEIKGPLLFGARGARRLVGRVPYTTIILFALIVMIKLNQIYYFTTLNRMYYFKARRGATRRAGD